MAEMAPLLDLSIEELQKLQSISTTIKAIGPEFVRNRNERVVYAGRKWNYDDYITLSYQWTMLAPRAGINTTVTKQWLRTEQRALERLGIALD